MPAGFPILGKRLRYVPKAAPAIEHHLFFGFLRPVAAIVDQTVNLPSDELELEATEAGSVGFLVGGPLERFADEGDLIVAQRSVGALKGVQQPADQGIWITSPRAR